MIAGFWTYNFIVYLAEAFSVPPEKVGEVLVALAFLFIGACFAVVMLYRLAKIYQAEVWNLKDFFVRSLQFRSYQLVKKNVFVELDKNQGYSFCTFPIRCGNN